MFLFSFSFRIGFSAVLEYLPKYVLLPFKKKKKDSCFLSFYPFFLMLLLFIFIMTTTMIMKNGDMTQICNLCGCRGEHPSTVLLALMMLLLLLSKGLMMLLLLLLLSVLYWVGEIFGFPMTR